VELTQSKYWEKAVERFAEFLPKGEVKHRRIPLSSADEKILTEPSEEEVKEAEHLPFPNLLRVVQYPSAFTKPTAIQCPSCPDTERDGERNILLSC
jgi:hypothetical protein